MTKQKVVVKMGQTELKERIVLHDQDTPMHGSEAQVVKSFLLRVVADQPMVTICSGESFESLKMYYDGMKWVVEVEGATTTIEE
jgi:hypothetical protein